MKNLIPMLLLVAVIYACSPTTIKTTDTASSESPAVALNTTTKMKESSKGENQPILIFTVKNLADTSATFCKWHTPFEPLMSKYLDIQNTAGEQVNYKGAMAKRIMPPPADSYLSIKPGDSLSVEVDLLKGYDISKAGTYSIKYVGENMSGLVVKDSLTFHFKP